MYMYTMYIGHMVPGDQPEVSLTMITDFIQGKEF